MKKIFFFLFILLQIFKFLFASDYFSTEQNPYILNETTVFIDNLPLLTLDSKRENSIVFPSIMSFLDKRKVVYVDKNGNQGGLIYFYKKTSFQVYYNANSGFFRNTPQGIVDLKMSDFQSIINGGVAYKFNKFFSFGSNLAFFFANNDNTKLVDSKESSKTKETNNDTTRKVDFYSDAYKIQFTPSLSIKTQKQKFDIGSIIEYQWINYSTIDPLLTYTKNMKFSFYARELFQITKYTKVSASAGFSTIPDFFVSLKDKTSKVDQTILYLKSGIILNPVKRLKLSSYVSFIKENFDWYERNFKKKLFQKQSKENLLAHLGGFAKIETFSHCFFKAGFLTIFSEHQNPLNIDFDNKGQSDVVSKNAAFNTENSEIDINFVNMIFYYFGFLYKNKGLSAELIINPSLINYPFFLNGNSLKETSFLVATVEYAW